MNAWYLPFIPKNKDMRCNLLITIILPVLASCIDQEVKNSLSFSAEQAAIRKIADIPLPVRYPFQIITEKNMPAQDIHILKNPMNETLSPWYEVDAKAMIYSPEWTFTPHPLKRW